MRIKAVAVSLWRLFLGLAYYPLIIGLMIWLYVKDHHWMWGVLVIIAVLVFDPVWGIIAKRVISWRPKGGR